MAGIGDKVSVCPRAGAANVLLARGTEVARGAQDTGVDGGAGHRGGQGSEGPLGGYLAKLTARVSLMTVTLIWPG